MRLNERAANSIAAVLPSCRVALVLGGALLLAESVVLASTFFAAAGLTFIASLLIATRIFRVCAPRPAEGEHGVAPSDAARA